MGKKNNFIRLRDIRHPLLDELIEFFRPYFLAIQNQYERIPDPSSEDELVFSNPKIVYHFLDTIMNSEKYRGSFTDFFEIGFGIGQNLVIASLLGFQRIGGVELYPARLSIAEKALHELVGEVDLSMLHQGGYENIPYPPRPEVLFFYFPFSEGILETPLDKLRMGQYIFVYQDPYHSEMRRLGFIPRMEQEYRGNDGMRIHARLYERARCKRFYTKSQ